MPGDTTRYSWPYQSLGDAPDGAALGSALATAVEATVGSIDDRVDALEDETAKPRGLVKYALRTTASGSTSGATVLGVLRLDNIPMVAGRAYLLMTANVRIDASVSTDRVKASLLANTGGVATIASTEYARAESAVADLNTLGNMQAMIFPAATVANAGAMIAISRPSGTGTAATVAEAMGLWLAVFDVGLAVANTGVAL